MLNNIITINFPQGCGGHIAGRILASSEDVAWYNHDQNGDNPWDLYTADLLFSKLHFTRRFVTDTIDGGVPPVLDMAEKKGVPYSRESLDPWLQMTSPKNILYPLHCDLPRTRRFFQSEKHLVIIPYNIDKLVEQWMRSSRFYFVSTNDKSFLYDDLYKQISIERNKSVEECVKEDLEKQVEQYKKDIIPKDVLINDVGEMFDPVNCESIMERLGLKFNLERFLKVMELVEKHSHL